MGGAVVVELLDAIESRGVLASTRHRVQAADEFVAPGGEVLGDVEQDLRAVVRRLPRPACSRTRRLNRVANVLAVPLADLERAIGAPDR